MSVRNIVTINDQDHQLLRPAEPIKQEEFATDDLKQVIADMHDTMMGSKGTGIAAPQIGVNKQLVVFGGKASLNFSDFEVPLTVLINPSYTPIGDEKVTIWEHCLSLPGKRGKTVRYKKIQYSGFDENAMPVSGEAEGILGILLQHEIDHLAGKLYPSRVQKCSLFGNIKDFEKMLGENHHKEHGLQPYLDDN